MNTQFKKIIGIILALFFLSGCAVRVRGGGGYYYHHHRHWDHWHHSSLQQSHQPTLENTTGESGVHEIP